LSGILFQAYVYSQYIGVIIYPVWYFGILELLRIFYWGDSRFFPVVVVSFFIVKKLKSIKRKIPDNALYC